MFSYTSVRECRLSCGLSSLGNNSNACKTYAFSYTSVHECRLSCGLSSFGNNSSACKTYVFSYTSVHECRLSCGLSSVGSNSNACKTYVFSYTSVHARGRERGQHGGGTLREYLGRVRLSETKLDEGHPRDKVR